MLKEVRVNRRSFEILLETYCQGRLKGKRLEMLGKVLVQSSGARKIFWERVQHSSMMRDSLADYVEKKILEDDSMERIRQAGQAARDLHIEPNGEFERPGYIKNRKRKRRRVPQSNWLSSIGGFSIGLIILLSLLYFALMNHSPSSDVTDKDSEVIHISKQIHDEKVNQRALADSSRKHRPRVAFHKPKLAKRKKNLQDVVRSEPKPLTNAVDNEVSEDKSNDESDTFLTVLNSNFKMEDFQNQSRRTQETLVKKSMPENAQGTEERLPEIAEVKTVQKRVVAELPPVIATIKIFQKGIHIVRNGQQLEPTGYQMIRENDHVMTNEKGYAEIMFDDDSTSMIVLPSTDFVVSSIKGKKIKVSKGSIWANVSKQPAGRPMKISTRSSMVEVLGTRLQVHDIAENKSHIVVKEGVVKTTNLENQTVEVRAGHHVLVEEGKELHPEKFNMFGSNSLRVMKGLVSAYLFNREGNARNKVYDISGVQPQVDLTILDMSAVAWGSQKQLILHKPTLIRSLGSCEKLYKSMLKTNELTVEAWVMPYENNFHADQGRIITYSDSSVKRNFTLGIYPDNAAMRIRTTKTSRNAMYRGSMSEIRFYRFQMPIQHAQHYLISRKSTGEIDYYVDGVRVFRKNVPGDFSSWSKGFTFALGDEISRGRSFIGEYFMVAIYNRAFDHAEVQKNFKAGVP